MSYYGYRRYMGRVVFALAVLPFILSGCSFLPLSSFRGDARDIHASYDLNTPYSNQISDEHPSSVSSDIPWWGLYGDEMLNAIMNRAFENSPTLFQTRARLDRAQALAYQSEASLLPVVNLNAERQTQRGDNASSSGFSLSGAAGYEIDLWGKNRAFAKADDLEFQASAEDLNAAHITLASSIVQTWLEYLSLSEQERIIRKQIDINKTILDLQHKRFEMGASRVLDVLQQQEILAQSESVLPDILSVQKQYLHMLAYLSGDRPDAVTDLDEGIDFPKPLPIPAIGLPSSLLAERPDVVAAWLRLQSTDWAQKSTWANRLPSFNVSANILTASSALSGLFDTWLLDMVAGVSAPLFDGGQRKAQDLAQRALADERYHSYRDTVLSAVKEVEDALVRNHYQDQKLESVEKQLLTARHSLEQAQSAYSGGQVGYVNVLNGLNTVQSLERQLAQERLTQSIERVNLYRALGGRAWAQDYIDYDVEQSRTTKHPKDTKLNLQEEKHG